MRTCQVWWKSLRCKILILVCLEYLPNKGILVGHDNHFILLFITLRSILGLVLKDLKSKYEPGKRHWLKVKKDYLNEGAMADTADLVVLGAWYGTGNKGGLMSVFLMGCYDEASKR